MGLNATWKCHTNLSPAGEFMDYGKSGINLSIILIDTPISSWKIISGNRFLI